MTKLDHITLSDEAARFAAAQVEAGRFRSIDDVLEAGVESLRRQEHGETTDRIIIAALEQGERSGVAEDGVFERVRARQGLPPRSGERKSLAQLFAESPLKGLSLPFERDQDTGRPLKL